jgi:hypothetical protein
VFDGRNLQRPMHDVLPSLSEGFQIMRGALIHQGVNVHMGRDVPGWLSPESDLWASMQPREPGKTVGFRNIEYKQVVIPAGPWPENPRLKALGIASADAWRRIWTSMEAPLQLFGLDEAKAKQLVRGAIEDVGRRDVAIAARYHMVHALKI